MADAVILLLRAVNLGKRNKVPMKELMRLLRDDGLGEPSYLLQSGNVVVSRPAVAPAELKRRAEGLVAEAFGVETVAVLRTADALARALAANPFEAPTGGSVQVSFWDEAVPAERLAALAEERFPDAQLHLTTREAYMRFESSTHASRLGNHMIERRLQVPATARNVRTLERLLELEALAGARGRSAT